MNKRQIGGKVTISDFELKYFLIESEIYLEGEKHISYGMEIVKEFSGEIENSSVDSVTTNPFYMEQIIEKMRENTVTPVHLVDVIENFL